MNRDFVVDASVGIKLFVDEPDSPLVDRLFLRLTASPPACFYVPDLFFVECANILWKYMRRFSYPAANARQDVAALGKLNSNALRPDGLTSADAAGLPILPGLVRYDEVQAGAIAPAIRFTAAARLWVGGWRVYLPLILR